MSREVETEPHAEDRPGASPDGLPPLRDVIRTYELAAKKSLGQNFLLDLNLTRRIARHAGELLGSRSGHLGGHTVIEVGPGPGGLTRALFLEGAGRVIAVERDERCLEALAEVSARYDGRLRVEPGDALDANWPALLKPDSKAIIAANLPYGVATLLLINWLETEPWPPWWEGMVLMFQKEVAERITAEPGSKAYGRLSVISQWRTEARIVMTLKPEAFTPPPKVASAVVAFRPRAEPQPACSVKALGAVTAAAFGQRRKMLRASLKALVPKTEELLEVAGISPELRAERVSVRDFAKLALVYEKSRAGRD